MVWVRSRVFVAFCGFRGIICVFGVGGIGIGRVFLFVGMVVLGRGFLGRRFLWYRVRVLVLALLFRFFWRGVSRVCLVVVRRVVVVCGVFVRGVVFRVFLVRFVGMLIVMYWRMFFCFLGV